MKEKVGGGEFPLGFITQSLDGCLWEEAGSYLGMEGATSWGGGRAPGGPCRPYLLRDGPEEAGGVLGRQLAVQPQAAQVLVHGHLAEGLLPEVLLPALLHRPWEVAEAAGGRPGLVLGGTGGGANEEGGRWRS